MENEELEEEYKFIEEYKKQYMFVKRGLVTYIESFNVLSNLYLSGPIPADIFALCIKKLSNLYYDRMTCLYTSKQKRKLSNTLHKFDRESECKE